MMKKAFALILSLFLVFAAFGALAEALEPMYATVGDALAAAGENPIVGGEEDYYAVVTEKDGTYYRSVAETDDRYRELQQATWEAEIDQIEAAFAAMEEYVKTLPISYSEAFTATPMEDAEMEALVGKTVGELREAGYEDRESGTEGDDIVYVMRRGLFDYSFTVDADMAAYDKAQNEGTDGEFVVKGAAFKGITSDACMKRFHTDGTVEEEPDPFAGYAELTEEIQEMLGQVQAGAEVDVDAFFDGLKEEHPDLAESIDMYVEIYKTLGAETLASLMTPVE